MVLFLDVIFLPQLLMNSCHVQKSGNSADITRIGMNIVAPLEVAFTSSVSMEQR